MVAKKIDDEFSDIPDKRKRYRLRNPEKHKESLRISRKKYELSDKGKVAKRRYRERSKKTNND